LASGGLAARYVESHGGANDFAYKNLTDYQAELFANFIMKTPFESPLMTRCLDQLTRMIVFLSSGLPVVFRSSLVKFRVVAVGVIVYVTYLCQFVVSLCFE
jgi:hypothetical protein